MQERDAYRIALLNASPNDPDSFAKGWLSAITWQTEVLVDALASAGLHGSNLQTAVLDNTPQPAITRKCPYSHCGWSTDDDTQPETLLQLHLRHSHPLSPPIVMPDIPVPVPHQHYYVDGQCVGCGEDEMFFLHGPTEAGTCQANNYACCEAGKCPPDYDCASHTSVEPES